MFQRLIYCIILYYVFISNYCLAENDNQIHSRLKRYEQFSEEEVPFNWSKTDNPSEECETWIHCIMDFFFGAVDMARGNPGGLFTRMVDWVKHGWCRMTKQCEDGNPHPEPSPDFIRPVLPTNEPPRPPPVDVTTPPLEASAEEVTEIEEVDKDVNDVQ